MGAPSTEDGLRQTFAEAHRRYIGRFNSRFKQTGHLWQGRFSGVVMDEGAFWRRKAGAEATGGSGRRSD